MPKKTFTTGQASVALGFMVNGKFILQMGLKPAELVKGNPIWDMDDWDTLKANLVEHVADLPPPTERAAAATTPKVAATKPTTPVDDDDEL